MKHCVWRYLGCLVLLSLGACRPSEEKKPPRTEEIPDYTWGGWWPKAQWSKERPPAGVENIRSFRRNWERVSYPAIETPWGHASPSLGINESNSRRCLRFDLVFSGPGTMDDEAWKRHKAPDAEAIRAEILSRSGKVRKPTYGPRLLGYAGGALGTSGDMLTEFEWLPDDLDDYWIRVQLPERTVWFLIPYGIGSDPTSPTPAISGGTGRPRIPKGKGEKDEIVPWSYVDYDLGWIGPGGGVHFEVPPDSKEWTADKVNVEVRMSNPEDGRCALTLYKESGSWSIRSPRTTVAIGTEKRGILFSALVDIKRHEAYRRTDSFHFARGSAEVRTWGVLRVTVEETVLEWAVPGSVFLHGHGGP